MCLTFTQSVFVCAVPVEFSFLNTVFEGDTRQTSLHGCVPCRSFVFSLYISSSLFLTVVDLPGVEVRLQDGGRVSQASGC